jgi:YhcH/YjgK/YiaL family protein
MILDTLANAARYVDLHPGFAAAFEQLRRTDLSTLNAGKYPIDGDRLILLIDQPEGRGRDGARLEAHRRYIDIQYSISGHEVIGWKSLAECSTSDPYADERDIEFFSDTPETWLALSPGKFTIFFPDDAHAPLAGVGPLHKAVLKIAVGHD